MSHQHSYLNMCWTRTPTIDMSKWTEKKPWGLNPTQRIIGKLRSAESGWEEHTDCLSNTAWSALKTCTCKWHNINSTGCIYIVMNTYTSPPPPNNNNKRESGHREKEKESKGMWEDLEGEKGRGKCFLILISKFFQIKNMWETRS